MASIVVRWARWSILNGGLLLVLALSSCRDLDSPAGPDELDLPPASESQATGRSPFGCFYAQRLTNGKYRHRQVPIPFSEEEIEASGGLHATPRYRLYSHDGVLLRVVNCWVPRLPGIHERVLDPYRPREHRGRPLDVGPTESSMRYGDTLVVTRVLAMQASEECTSTYIGPECYVVLDGVVAEECSADSTDPACEEETTLSDGSEGGGTGGSCTTCDYDDGSGSTGGGSSSVSISLDCDVRVPRGQEQLCRVLADGSSNVSGWRFEAAGFNPIAAPGSYSWKGVAVVGGTVTAYASLEGQAVTLQRVFYVDPRASGKWTQTHWESTFSFTQGALPESCKQSARPVSGKRLGWVGSTALNCEGTVPTPKATSGASLTSVPSGPNTGLWYVSDASYVFTIGSQIHPGIRPGAPGYKLTDPEQISVCRQALGLGAGSDVIINFWDFNASCAKVAGWNGFVDAIWAHEYDHYLNARAEAAASGRNPYLQVEGIVESDAGRLASALADRYWTVANGIAAAGDSPEPDENWTARFWVWASDTENVFFASDTNF